MNNINIDNMLNFIKEVLENMPSDWIKLTTHRLDIYNEELAKTQFLEQLEELQKSNDASASALNELPTAFDYIRLGHPLSSVLEWVIASQHKVSAESVISFGSTTAPILAILRVNSLQNKDTLIAYTGELPEVLKSDVLQKVYGYQFELKQVETSEGIPEFEGSVISLCQKQDIHQFEPNENTDFHINIQSGLGSIVLINGEKNSGYISEIQHFRRRETIAMTPANCLTVLQSLVGQSVETAEKDLESNKNLVLGSIKEITGADTPALVGSSGLSIQYGIMMGLVHDAKEKHPGKAIKFAIPPNCYGGTNDQARRVAASIAEVEVVDLPVDGDNDMVQSIERVLNEIAQEDAVPYIIAEIPTNPRVEVPNLQKLKEALSKKRKTSDGQTAIDPVFILDQTFCPNVHFLGEGEILSGVRTISYVSGSKFPSGGLCTAGYCVANQKAAELMFKIGVHLELCDNEATDLQMEILANQLPSMIQRIQDAYVNTREFVSFIEEKLPDAKINFVSEELAKQGFTPSVFSLDLPTKGETEEERETYKRALNLKLINLMISEIPNESKYCVSYGQLKGCYWTIPATSTQGTTKEGDKDYIARVALSGNMDLEKHKQVFSDFVESIHS